MSKFSKKMKQKYKASSKVSVTIYYILRILVILGMVLQMIIGNFYNAFLCIVTLFLFTLPTFVSEKFKMELPTALEAIIYIFIYSSAILGEINNFYRIIPFWDTILHTLNGFICAGIGFSLVDMLNENGKKISLSPFYVAVVAFCFSMTIGVLWEFYEFSADYVMKTDMQKDTIIHNISSVELNKEKKNEPVRVKNIDKTEIHSKDGTTTTIDGGYLDIGLIDTMEDLFVNLIGAFTFSIIGYIYEKTKGKDKFASNFIPKKIEQN